MAAFLCKHKRGQFFTQSNYKKYGDSVLPRVMVCDKYPQHKSSEEIIWCDGAAAAMRTLVKEKQQLNGGNVEIHYHRHLFYKMPIPNDIGESLISTGKMY